MPRVAPTRCQSCVRSRSVVVSSRQRSVGCPLVNQLHQPNQLDLFHLFHLLFSSAWARSPGTPHTHTQLFSVVTFCSYLLVISCFTSAFCLCNCLRNSLVNCLQQCHELPLPDANRCQLHQSCVRSRWAVVRSQSDAHWWINCSNRINWISSISSISCSLQREHAALARRPGTPSTPSKCTSRCRVISITFPSHDSDDIPISLPPHASRPAASNLSNFSVFRDSKSGTSNTTSNAAYARRCMLWRWPRPQLQRPHSCGCLHDCCSCPRKQFYVAEIETVQNFQNETRNGSELVTQKRNGSELLLWKTKRFRISNTKTKRFRIAVMKNETVQNWKHKNETV